MERSSLSPSKLSHFLKSLDDVIQDLTCAVCHELCKDPVTLSKCFHWICSEHFEGLETCPKCEVSLEGCTTLMNDGLSKAVSAAKELDQTFEKYRDMDASSKADQSSRHTTGKPDKAKNTSKTFKHVETKDTSKGLQSKNTGKIRSKQAIEKITIEDDVTLNENKKNFQVKADSKGKKKETSKDQQCKEAGKKQSKQAMEDDDYLSLKDNKMNDSVKDVSKSRIRVTTDNKSHSDNVNLSALSEMSSKVNKAFEKRNIKGETSLHIACRLGKADKVTELLKLGANANTKDNAGWTPLHEVVQNGHLDLVRLLIQYNALVNVPGQSNETPLHEAVRYKHREIAEELITHGADLNARNCKGETPIQLASVDMKELLEEATENIIQTQSMNITHISEIYNELDYEDIRLFCVFESRIVQNKLKSLLRHHSNLHLEAKWTERVTHLIVDADEDGVCQPSLEVLQGIVARVWILSTGWLMKSSKDTLQPFDNYEISGVGAKTYNGPRNARHNKYKQLPGIFDGCHFYLHNFTGKYEISEKIVLTKGVLNKLIADAGGVVLRRVPNPESIPEAEKLVPYHAKKDGKLVNCSHYIIFKDLYEPMYNMQHLKALPIGWLIECIEKYELCEPW